ncbi:MAG: hypothetical protein ACIAZJ_04735 [Gimesia chilikensis]|uniref:hypothetical protein n=1 Tax=Gimesia chilikensis TaxID=2605989 RepID=UPI00379ED75A
MNQYQSQPDYVSNTYRTISGQLAEWGIEFSPDRVADLNPEQRSHLQTWINAGVDADEECRAEFASLPEFMESELLEMRGILATEPRETIIEQGINACESQTPIAENPYLFDTTGWHLWRQAYCRWHHGESLDFSDEALPSVTDQRQSETEIDVASLIRLAPELVKVERSLSQLRRKVKQAKSQRKQLLSQLSHSLETISQEVEVEQMQLSSTISDCEQTRSVPKPARVITEGETEVVRIPVTGPETNRIEILLAQNSAGDWRSGSRWSVETDVLLGKRSNGGVSLNQSSQSFPSQTAALLNAVLVLSRGLIGNAEIEEQVVDYLNLLEESPGQIAVCGKCGNHWLQDDMDAQGICPDCQPVIDSRQN